MNGHRTLVAKACTGVLVLALLGSVASSTLVQNDLSWTGPFAVRVDLPEPVLWVIPKSIAAKTSPTLVGLWYCEYMAHNEIVWLFGVSDNAAAWTDLIEVDEIFSGVLAGEYMFGACLDVLSNGSTVLAVQWRTWNDSTPTDHIALSISSINDVTWGPAKTIAPVPDFVPSLVAIHQYGGSFRLVVQEEDAVEIWTLDAALTNVTARLHYDLPTADVGVSSSKVFGDKLALLLVRYAADEAFVLTTDGSSWERWNVSSSLGGFGELAVWNNQTFVLHSSFYHMGVHSYSEGLFWSQVLPDNASQTWYLLDTRRIWTPASLFHPVPVQHSEAPMVLLQTYQPGSPVGLFIRNTNYLPILATFAFSVLFVIVLLLPSASLVQLARTKLRGVRG